MLWDSLLEKLKAAGPKGEPSSARKRALMRKHLLESLKKKSPKTSIQLSAWPSPDSQDENALLSPIGACISVSNKCGPSRN